MTEQAQEQTAADTQQGDPPQGQDGGSPQEQTFTQADVDRIVKERVKRTEAKYADYSELKTRAEGAKTLEERLATHETEHSVAQQRAMRAEIANKHGISAEDRDLFLTGSDEETLTAQAERLAARESERKQKGNHVPGEGNNSSAEGNDGAFVRNLFSSAAADGG